jgi:hypothetical protein
MHSLFRETPLPRGSENTIREMILNQVVFRGMPNSLSNVSVDQMLADL